MSASNPKDVEAKKLGKAPLDLLEPAADEQIAEALAFGASKYGVRNYVESPIEARVYVAAIRRHLAAWLRGEDYAEDSGVHHLAHIGANVHVALAAIEAGSFVDNRHGAPGEADPPREEAPSWEELELSPFVLAVREVVEETHEAIAKRVDALIEDDDIPTGVELGPCPFRGLGNDGTCSLAGHFSGGYAECHRSCVRAEEGSR